MKIKKVAVLGAGAVGSYVIWGLSSRNDIELGVIAEGERAERLKQNGCTINGKIYHPEVWNSGETDAVDLLIVALKYGSLSAALESIQKVTTENTVIMSLMNGVDSEEIIAEKVGVKHLLPAVIKVASHKEEDGYHFDPETTIGIIFGELTAPYDSDRIRAIEELFKDTGIHFRATEYAREEMWSKFRLNVCNNLPQAILGAGVGCYRDSVHMKAISDGLKGELEAIAQAKGIDLSKTEASSGRGSAVPPSARYSTLQDLDAGRHTEIDMFSGALIRMGKELGIPTPYNDHGGTVEIRKGHRTDIVKLGTIAEHIALPALLHGSCFNCRFIGIRGSTATLSGKSIGSKKAFGKMITTNRIHSLITNYCFCSALQLSTYKKNLKASSCQCLGMYHCIGNKYCPCNLKKLQDIPSSSTCINIDKILILDKTCCIFCDPVLLFQLQSHFLGN